MDISALHSSQKEAHHNALALFPQPASIHRSRLAEKLAAAKLKVASHSDRHVYEDFEREGMASDAREAWLRPLKRETSDDAIRGEDGMESYATDDLKGTDDESQMGWQIADELITSGDAGEAARRRKRRRRREGQHSSSLGAAPQSKPTDRPAALHDRHDENGDYYDGDAGYSRTPDDLDLDVDGLSGSYFDVHIGNVHDVKTAAENAYAKVKKLHAKRQKKMKRKEEKEAKRERKQKHSGHSGIDAVMQDKTSTVALLSPNATRMEHAAAVEAEANAERDAAQADTDEAMSLLGAPVPFDGENIAIDGAPQVAALPDSEHRAHVAPHGPAWVAKPRAAGSTPHDANVLLNVSASTALSESPPQAMTSASQAIGQARSSAPVAVVAGQGSIPGGSPRVASHIADADANDGMTMPMHHAADELPGISGLSSMCSYASFANR